MIVKICDMIYLKDRTILAIGGTDRYKFLNGINCNNLDRLQQKQQESLWLCFLTPQGRYYIDCFAFHDDDYIYCDVEYAHLVNLGNYIMQYRLSSDIHAVPYISAKIFAFAEKSDHKNIKSYFHYLDPRHDMLGSRYCDLLGKTDIADNHQVYHLYDKKRISLGLIDGSKDMQPTKNFPLEAGLHELNAIDYKKGCYTGQELTARLYHRGGLKGRFLPITLSHQMVNNAIQPGHCLYNDMDKEIGHISSQCDDSALAYIRMDAMDKVDKTNSTLHYKIGDKKFTATIQYPTWFDKNVGRKEKT